MNSPQTGSLKESIAAALPSTFKCKVRYVHTAPKRCDALFSPPPGLEPEKTRLSSHFLTISMNPKSGDGTGDVLVLGIEALIYHTRHLTTIFVSKADSTGYLSQQRPSPIKQIATAFLRWLSAKERRKHPKRDLVISLFARSQSQYLFPGSAENNKKHILDDRQLIKWWGRVLDPLFSTATAHFQYNGYITVPGYEGLEVRQFFPPSAQVGKQWHPGNPLAELAVARGISKDAPPRCLLPRFPDDPKARFMSDLDDEVGFSEDTLVSPSKRKNGKWKSIWNLNRFWEAMEFRQECSSGRMVGFLWLVICNSEARRERERIRLDEVQEDSSQHSLAGATIRATNVEQQNPAAINGSPPKQRRKHLTGPIIPRQPRLKGGSSSMTASSGFESMLDTTTEDGLVLTQGGYDQAMQTMLHLDFATLAVAMQSTSKWIKQVTDIGGGKTDCCVEVSGTAAPAEAIANGNGFSQVNDLGGMVRKKKRKAEDSAVAEDHAAVESKLETAVLERPAVNMLGAGMVRKKPKPAAA